MLADVRCFFSGFSSPLPTPLVSTGVGEVWETRDFEIFSFYHWLAPYWLQRDSSPRLIVCSAFSSPSLGAWDPQPLFWARRRCALPRGSGPRGWQERRVAAAACLTCFHWISALLLLECWALIESFMVLKVLLWHVSPLIPTSRGDP